MKENKGNTDNETGLHLCIELPEDIQEVGILDKYKKDEEERKQKIEEKERKEYERLKQKYG